MLTNNEYTYDIKLVYNELCYTVMHKHICLYN